MNNVSGYVDKLFAKYPKTNETLDLKEEVIGNLEAEIEDLQSNGISFEEAFRVSIEKVSNLDGLIEGVKSISAQKVVFDMLQWALIYTIIAWILTIPLSLVGYMGKVLWLLLFMIMGVGCVYLFFFIGRNLFFQGQVSIDLFKMAKVERYVWAIWGVFLFISWGVITGLFFGSDLWFSRPISISGPYEFANIAAVYVAPLPTIVIPLLVHRLEVYAVQYEEGWGK